MKKIPLPVDKHVGLRVRGARLELRMSQEKLGEALGITFQQIQKYEKGTNRIGSSRMMQIAITLQKPIEWFFAAAPGSRLVVPDDGNSISSAFFAEHYAIELAQAFMKVDDSGRRLLIDMAKALAHGEAGSGCCICGRPYRRSGNNAAPVKKGRICDHCNETIVIPARIASARSGEDDCE